MNMSPPLKGANKAKITTQVLPDGRVTLDAAFNDGTKITVFENLEHRTKWVQAGMDAFFRRIIRLAVGVDGAKAAVQEARSTMENGGFPAKASSAGIARRRTGEITELALAIAEVDKLPAAKVQEWLDAQEREQHGFKLRQRNNPRYMAALAKFLKQGGGQGEKLEIDLNSLH